MGQRTLIRRVRQMLACAQQARRTGAPAAEVLAGARVGWSRRQVLKGAGAVGLVPLISCAPRGFQDNPGGARVVIVGAGLAGMACCHHLAKHGIYARVYEALPEVGGRCRTGRDLFAGGEGLATELGGQFIDSIHAATLRLAGELELDLLDFSTEEDYAIYYDLLGQRYREDALIESLLPVYDAIDQAWLTIRDDGETISYQDDGGALGWDRMSIAEFLEQAGAAPLATALIRSSYISEYGLEIERQSSLNLLFLLGTDPGELALYGYSDERYKIDGGNDQLVTRLAERYEDRVELSRVLTAVSEASDGSFRLSFEDGSTVAADYVLLSIPFSVLRRLDLDVPLSDIKRTAIDTLGYGTNAKLLLPFSQRFWREQGDSGEFYSDQDALQSGWDGTQLQPGDFGVLTIYRGGDSGAALGEGTVTERAYDALAALDTMYKDCGQFSSPGPQRVPWPDLPTSLGSYACYEVGQFTGIGGAEAEASGNVRFLGEHTSSDWQGYMNGSVASGVREAALLASELWTGAAWATPRPVRSARRFLRPGMRQLDALAVELVEGRLRP